MRRRDAEALMKARTHRREHERARAKFRSAMRDPGAVARRFAEYLAAAQRDGFATVASSPDEIVVGRGAGEAPC